MFSENNLKEAEQIMGRYPTGKHKSALIPLLHIAQQQNNNWLSPAAMDEVAGILKIDPIEVYEVATFYSMFNLKPVGAYVFEVCQTGPCMLNGSDNIIDYIKEKLDIEVGGTSVDGLFTLKTVECLGACGYAPMMQMGKFYKEHLTKDKVDDIISECRRNVVKNN